MNHKLPKEAKCVTNASLAGGGRIRQGWKYENDYYETFHYSGALNFSEVIKLTTTPVWAGGSSTDESVVVPLTEYEIRVRSATIPQLLQWALDGLVDDANSRCSIPAIRELANRANCKQNKKK